MVFFLYPPPPPPKKNKKQKTSGFLMLSGGKERKVLEKMGQGIQKWTKSNFWKTASKKFVVTSDYLNVVFHKFLLGLFLNTLT